MEDIKEIKLQPYTELVKQVNDLEAKIASMESVTADYKENDPTKKSYIRNRLFYEEGEPETTYTPESYDVRPEGMMVWAGLATLNVIEGTQLSDYLISIELKGGINAEVIDTLTLPLNRLRETKTYSGASHIGSKYSTSVGQLEYADALVYIIYDYETYNEVVKDYRHPNFPSNGIYLCLSTADGSTDGTPHTNFTTVKSLTKISTLKLHRLDPKFIDFYKKINQNVAVKSLDADYLEVDKQAIFGENDGVVIRDNIWIYDKLVATEEYVDESMEHINYESLRNRPFGDDVGEPINVLLTHALPNGHRVSFDGGTSDTWEAYQVSKSTYTKEQLLGGSVDGTFDKFIIDESHIVEDTDDGLMLRFKQEYGSISYYIWVAYTTSYQPEGFDAPLPDVGVYFSSAYNDYEGWSINQLGFSYQLKKLDNKYLDLPNNDDFKALKQKVDEGGSGATVDKIIYSNLNSEQTVVEPIHDYGIGWSNKAEVELKNGDLYYIPVDFHVPLVAGDNITFYADEDNNVIKINSTGGVGGSTEAIIDVTSLPTENINENAFYRLLTGSLVINQVVQNAYTVYCVDTLPEVGLPATNVDKSQGNVYFNVQDGNAYGYVDDILSYALSVPKGWYPAETLLFALGYGYKGVITDILDDPKDDDFRLLLEYVIWQYKDGKWNSLKSIGWVGTGASAEVFNHPSNVASGECSHAEGYQTNSIGYCSHTEGRDTIASCADQHVQGRYNIKDTENKYAHIVGNGEYGNRSNAHTLDWQGNAWFAGEVYVGGTGQDDENAEKLVKQSELDEALENVGGSDNITVIDTYYGDTEEVEATEVGLSWSQYFAMFNDDGEIVNEGSIAQRVPIVAGENVTFETTDDNSKVKINATGGTDGYTPVRGTDYWTDADKAEIKAYVDDAILGGAW